MGGLKRRWVLTGLAGAIGASIAGCASKDPTVAMPPVRPTPTPEETPSPTVDTTPRWPLTGVPFEDGDEKKAARSLVAVKVPVEKRSFPQSGVDKADIVFVQSQGNSYDITRLCAVYHSDFPDEGANPVRSTRPVDVPLLAPLKGVLACTGAVPWVIEYVDEHNKYIELREKYGDRTDRWKTWNPGGWWKGGNLADKSVVAMPKALSRDAQLVPATIPPVYLQYAAPDEDPSTVNGDDATQVTIIYSGSAEEHHRWAWSGKDWKKSIRFQEGETWFDWTVRDGTQVSAPNVLIVHCEWKMGVIKGFSGHKEPIYSIIDGSDKFIYCHDGKYVTGTWKKGKATEMFEFALDDGTPLKMAPGRTWIEMPHSNDVITIE